MAEPDETKSSPFDFSRVPGSDTFGALKQQWDGFLEQPGARTALLQFGINMMQPPSFGDTAFSQAGRALGAAGEAVTGQMEAQRKERESEANVTLKEAKALAAEGLLAKREGAADIAEKKLGLLEQRIKDQRQRALEIRDSDFMKAYVGTVKEIEKRNAQAKLKEPFNKAVDPNYVFKPEPIPTIEEFAARVGRPVPSSSGAGSAFTSPGTGAPPASPDLTGRGGPTGSIIDVQTVEEANALPAGQKYRTPEGKVYTR